MQWLGGNPNSVIIDHLKFVRQFKTVLWPHAWHLCAVLVLIVLTSLLEGVSLSLIVPLVQTFTGGNGIDKEGFGIFQTYQEWLADYEMEDRLMILGLAIMVLFALKNGLQYMREVLSSSLWLGISFETRSKVLDSVLRRPHAYFLDKKHGMLVQYLYHEPHNMALIVQLGTEVLTTFLIVSVLIGLLVLVSWKITAIVMVFGACYGYMIWWLSKRVHNQGDLRQETESEAVGILTEAIAGIRQVKIFSAERRIQEIYAKLVQSFQNLYLQYCKAVVRPVRANEIFSIWVLGLLFCLPALRLIDYRSLLPAVAIVSAVVMRVGPHMSRISQHWLSIRFFLPSARIVGQLLEDQEGSNRKKIKPLFRGLTKSIQVEKVSFSYDGIPYPALSDVSVTFKKGEITSIVGRSGAGKSTLVDLLVGLYQPTHGSIMIDGIDLRTYDLDSWLAVIGFVSQDTFIFHGTIYDNIAFGKPGAAPEEIEKAALQANAHDFIARLPKGYDTIVGERGFKLSGGERQRLAIARALLREPQILIFDEATSALDNQSEASIHEAIAGLARERTMILVSHRLSPVIRADKVLVLDRGRVAEEGTHDVLLAKGRLYPALYGKRWIMPGL